jgi:outer membrane biosynthesis protein TonB
MSVTTSQEISLRQKVDPLVWAFGISLTIHLLLFGGFKLGQRYDLWNKSLLPAWLKKSLSSLKTAQKKPPVNTEPPLLFIDVNPVQAATEAPKDAKYYSALNSKAANPDSQIDANVPRITGKQTQVPKTEDVPRTKQFPLQPTPPTPKPEATEPRPKTGPTPGDLALGKPAPQPDNSDSKPAERERPRTLAAAKALPGEKMKQEGGVRKRVEMTSVDAKATPFGAYDAVFIDAVQRHWFDLLEKRNFARDRTGKVVLEFRLNYDGRITEMKEVENDVGELLGLLCQMAVLDPARYADWPSDMRRLVGADYREVRFTFYYN